MTVNTAIVALLPALDVEVEAIEILADLEHDDLRDHLAKMGTIDVGSEGRIRAVE